MLASSLLVLSALTLTGVYVKERTRIQNENSAELSREETQKMQAETEEDKSSPVNVGSAVNPGVKEDALESDFGSYESRINEISRATEMDTEVDETVEEDNSEAGKVQ